MHQVSSRLSKLALSVMLAFALVPTASVAAMADPQISDPASDPVIQSPSIDQGVSEEAPASTESWQGEGSEPAEADETAQPDSEAEASAAALGPDRQPVGFVYFDERLPQRGRFPARRGCAGRRVDRADVRRTDADGSFGRVGQSDRFRVRGQCGALLRRRSGAGSTVSNGWRARLPPTAARCWWICPPVRRALRVHGGRAASRSVFPVR